MCREYTLKHTQVIPEHTTAIPLCSADTHKPKSPNTVRDIRDFIGKRETVVVYKNGGIRRIHSNNHKKRAKTENKDREVQKE